MSKFLIRRLLLGIFIIVMGSLVFYSIIRCLPASYVEKMARQFAASTNGRKTYQPQLSAHASFTIVLVMMVLVPLFLAAYRDMDMQTLYAAFRFMLGSDDCFSGKGRVDFVQKRCLALLVQ